MKTSLSNPIHCLPLLAASLLMVLTAHAEPPVKIYILAGQYNMQGKGDIDGDGGNSLRSLVNGEAKKDYQFLVQDDGEWVERKDVWMHYDLAPFQGLRHGPLTPGYGSSGGQVGPEIGFGHKMVDHQDGQVLIIKAAWGGKSIGHNFLPPSIGKYETPVDPDAPGYFLHQTLNLVEQVTEKIDILFPDYKGQGVEVAGICWHQGWNDQYGDLAPEYETNLAAFIRDIRSAEHGLGIPDLPFVIATSGMMPADSPVVKGQLAMADAQKYPDFVGNVAVVDTHQAYGPDKMTFKFDKDGQPTEAVSYHWNNNARSYTNIGIAMAGEMPKLNRPKSPARFMVNGTEKGVQLHWQIGTEKPKGVEILRNGKKLDAKISPTQTAYVDTSALPGANSYELILDMPSGKVKFNDACDTSVTNLTAYRSLDGVVLSWEARGNYDAFRITRDGKVIADEVAADARSYKDKSAPAKGKVSYAIEPTAGKVTPATLAMNIASADPAGALIYEPFDYPANPGEPLDLTGKEGAHGTKGGYIYMSDKNPERAPAALAKGLSYGELPVTGNHGSTNRWSADTYIELDGSLQKAGLLKDGATLWISYLFDSAPEVHGQTYEHRSGGGMITLRTADMKEGIGFKVRARQYETVVVEDGKEKRVRVTSPNANTPTLVVARIIWGKDGENDSFVPFPRIGPDLVLPEKEGREPKPFNIDQSKISRLVLGGEGQFDEIRIGPTFESVIGAAE